MAVDFLTEEQKQSYGRYNDEPSILQLSRYFHLDDNDRSVIQKYRGDHNRLGYALQLVTVRFLGTFLSNPIDIPSGVIHFVSQQLSISETICLDKYVKFKKTRYQHCDDIKIVYGYHDFNIQPFRFRYLRWLYSRNWLKVERPIVIFDLSTAWLAERKILLPGVTTLMRLISQVRERCDQKLWNDLSQLPDDQQKKKLEWLLTFPNDVKYSHLDRLRRAPTRISGPALVSALQRYQELRDFNVNQLNFSKIPSARLKVLAKYAVITPVSKLARLSNSKRIATLLAFVNLYEIEALDDALDVLDLLITAIATQAKNLGKKDRLRTLRDLDKAALTLKDACVILVDDAIENDQLREKLFDEIGKEKVLQAIETIQHLARPSDDNYHQELVDRYRRVRIFLPELLDKIQFFSTASGMTVLESYDYLKSIESSKKTLLSDAPLEVISKPWKRLVMDDKNRVKRQAYTLCVLEQVQDKLRRRDIFVNNSQRWGDPRLKLINQNQWQIKKAQICRSLNLPLDFSVALNQLREKLDDAYTKTANNLPNNNALCMTEEKDRPFILSHLDKIDEPESLLKLRKAVDNLLPRIDLPELLLEIHAHTGFADEFVHLTEQQARVANAPTSVCAVLLAEACNIGLEPLIRPQNPVLSRQRLGWIQQNYIREDTIALANARLVNYQNKLDLVKHWGGGEVASADGLRFVVAARSINSRPNPKYYGYKRGLTYYNFMSDQFGGFHGIVVPGTLRDSLFILEGLLEQQTGLNPTEIMADTAGVSDIIFALFWLLGYQFSPRLADIAEARFWRIDPEKDYGALERLAKHTVNVHRIDQHWEDILRIAGSLTTGTIKASELLRTLLKTDRPSDLTKALMDLGRIPKTLYLLNYIDDESYRRRILIQLNRGEARHAVARTIFYGQRGEIRKKYRPGQEDQLNTLGLVTNAVILWNTIYMEAALNQLRAQGYEVLEEDIARLAPLSYKHINMLGKYSFYLASEIRKGQLRSLHVPESDYELLLG